MTSYYSSSAILRRIFVLYALFLLPLAILAQGTIQQTGVVYRYNGKIAKTPLGKVYIKVEKASNGVLSDSIKGLFTLNFSGLTMGSRIGNVQVQKRGMMIFNQQAVDEWNIRKEPLILILCDADEFEKQKQHYVKVGYSEAKRNFDKRVAEIEDKYKEIDTKHKTDSMEMFQKLTEAEEELRKIQKHIYEYADAIARIDQSELDSQMQEILNLYSMGMIEIAIQRLDSLNIIDKFDKHVKNRNNLEQQVSAFNEDIASLIEKMRAAVPILQSNGKWEQAKQYLKRIADESRSTGDYMEYAELCYNFNNFNEAEEYYKKALSVTRNKREIDCEDDVALMLLESILLCDIADVYSMTNRYNDSENYYLQSIDIINKMDAPNPNGKFAILAGYQLGLAQLYCKNKRFKESITLLKSLEKALSQSKNSYIYSVTKYKAQLAEAIMTLGWVYYSTKQYARSEKEYTKAIELYQHLTTEDSQDYEENLANAYYNVALLYQAIHNERYCEDNFKKALDLYIKGAALNPYMHQNHLTLTLRNLRQYYSEIENKDKFEQQLKEEIQIYQQLALTYPQIFKYDVVRSLHRLAEYYQTIDHYAECDSLYQLALSNLKDLAKNAAGKYDRTMAYTYYCIGNAKILNFVNNEALPAFLEATKLYNQVFKRDSTISRFHIDALENVRRCYNWNKDYSSTIQISEQLVKLTETYYNKDPKRWRWDYSRVLSSYSSDFILCGNFKEAEQYAHKSISIEKRYFNYIPLSFSLLFQGKYTDAENIIIQHKDRLFKGFDKKFGHYFLLALNNYAEAGVIPEERKEDVERIKRILNEP